MQWNNMEKNQDGSFVVDSRLHDIVQCLTNWKTEFLKEKEECKKLREINSKIEVELSEARELEKSHRYHLLTSREMIGNLQETVSQLVYLKRDIKRLKEEMFAKDTTITTLEKERENLLQKQNNNVMDLQKAQEKLLQELNIDYEKRIQQVHQDSDTQVAQLSCLIEELRCKLKETEIENRDKMNLVVLEYEEKIERGAAQLAQLQEQLARQAARTDANIDAYRRRLEELEEKLKQSQFKQYLAQNSYASQYESQVERPYSVNRDAYAETCSVDLDPVLEQKSKVNTRNTPLNNQNKTPKPSTLQVMYYDNRTNPKTDKKGSFHITKKRKLYNDKDFQDF